MAIAGGELGGELGGDGILKIFDKGVLSAAGSTGAVSIVAEFDRSKASSILTPKARSPNTQFREI